MRPLAEPLPQWEDVPLPGLDHLQPASHPAPARAVPSSSTLLPSSADVARFWKHVVVSPTCWYWVGAISIPDGYGRFTWQRGGVQRTLAAHRFSLLASGQDIEGQVAEHYCNEPLCVRVGSEHVFASTQAANVAYAVRLGRHRGNLRTVSEESARSLQIRAALAEGWDHEAYLRAVIEVDQDQSLLF